jgi:hypothetical protein
MVGEVLEADYAADRSEFERLKKLQDDTIAQIRRERVNGPYFSAEDRLTRDEVHDSNALRRLERSSL